MLKPEFSVRRLGDRYDRGEVDAFLDTAEEWLTAPR